jgi:hypothetical protein
VTNAVGIQEDRSPREAGLSERTKLANLFAAIGNATNETIQDMPELSDERVRRQMMHTFAAVGGFPDNFQIGLLLENPAEPLSQDIVIVS